MASDCSPLMAQCIPPGQPGENKCKCLESHRHFLIDVNPAQTLADGQDYTKVCEYLSECEEFENATPCGLHSYCEIDASKFSLINDLYAIVNSYN